MTGRGFPPILDFGHLASLLGRTPAYLASAINGTKCHYRQFVIPKRRGGARTISAPYPALLECQQWINREILEHIDVHSAAHGFRRKRSIATNASQHLNKACLLKMDIKDFFPSIKLRRVIAVFRDLGYPKNISVYLGRLCSLDGQLPQGAATSPAMSNIIAKQLDCRLLGVAKKWRLRYTRYADDLCFSGPHISIQFPKLVSRICEEEGLQINASKTQLCRSKGRRIVTGLSVSGERLRVPRAFKREVRQEMHYIKVHGYWSHVSKRKIRNPFYLQSLYGKLMFWRWIEPDNSFVNSAFDVLRNLVHENGEFEKD